MAQKKDNQLIIVAVKGEMHRQIFGPAIPSVIGSEKKNLKQSGNWRGWDLQTRTQEGYKTQPILRAKPLTFEQKLKRIKA